MENEKEERKRLIGLFALVLGGILLGFILLIYIAIIGM